MVKWSITAEEWAVTRVLSHGDTALLLFAGMMSRSGVSTPGGGSGRAGGSAGASNNNDYFVDTKLLFRLKQFVGEQHRRGGVATEDAALDYLLDKFKEYVRKPQVCTRFFAACIRMEMLVKPRPNEVMAEFCATNGTARLVCNTATQQLVSPAMVSDVVHTAGMA